MLTSNRRPGIMLVLVTAISTSSWGQAEPTAAPALASPEGDSAGPKVKLVRMNKDDGRGGIGEAATSFRVGDRKLHFHVELEALKLGQTTAKWVFRGVETEAGKNLTIAEYSTSGLIVNQVDGTVSLRRDWPAGKYTADLYVDGRLVHSIAYEVHRSPADIHVTSVHFYRDDGKGNPGEEVKKFKPSDHILHLAAETSGLGLQPKITWIYKAVDTSAGKNIRIASVAGGVGEANMNILTSKCELPRDWPKGSYQAFLVIGDKLIQTIDFAIE